MVAGLALSAQHLLCGPSPCVFRWLLSAAPLPRDHIPEGLKGSISLDVRCRQGGNQWKTDMSTGGERGNAQGRERGQQGMVPRRKPSENPSREGVGRGGNDNDQVREGRRRHPRFEPDVSSHRAVAVVRLLRIEEGGAYSDVLTGEGENSWENEMAYVGRTLGFRTSELELRGRRLVTDEVAGVVRFKRYLDFLIFSFYKNDVRDYDRMEPLLRQILRVGIYELLKLEMPPHAVLNETVKLAKVALREGAGNMVNGLLRSVLAHKEKGTLPFPPVEGDDRSRARALATVYSHPVGKQCSGHNKRGSDFRTGKLEVAHTESPYLQDFVRISIGMQEVLRSGLLQKGSCAVQDESAGLVVAVVDAQPGDTVIDCCAAPGGKALSLASRLKGQGAGTGRVIAVDVNEGRLRMLTEAAQQQGVDDIVTSCHYDLRDFAVKGTTSADRVLVDAPCSGLGVLSKRADLRWKRAAEDLQQLTDLQDSLLDAASLAGKPGGVLVYSTCSIEPNENSERVAAFLSNHPEFSIETVEGFVPMAMVSKEGYFVSYPHRHQIDGAFAARMRRKC